MTKMHEWILVSLFFEWETGSLTVIFDSHEHGLTSLIAEGVCELFVPRMSSWGPSVSVNSVEGPLNVANGRQRLEIEMQSGDTIKIEAKSFDLPASAAAKSSALL